MFLLCLRVFFSIIIFLFPLCHQKREKEEGKKILKSNGLVLNDIFYLKSNYPGSFTSAIETDEKREGLLSLRKAVLMVGSKDFSRHKA